MLFHLWITFLKIGLFTFGGGYAMIAQIKEHILEKKGWLTEEEFIEIIAIAESTPGPLAINLATFVGYKKRGFLGSLVATLGVVIPSLVIIFLLSLFLSSIMENRYVQYAFIGIQCGVCYLIIKTGFSMVYHMKKSKYRIIILMIALLSALIFKITSIDFSSIFFILIGGILGIVFSSLSSYFKKEDQK